MKEEKQDLIQILEKYAKEYGEDTYIDELRLRELELKIPGIKGKWASYKAYNRAELYKLKKQRDHLLEEGIALVKNKKESEGEPISKIGAERIIKNTKRHIELDEKIERMTILCDYFDDCLKNIQTIGFDIKNLVETIKMDEM